MHILKFLASDLHRYHNTEFIVFFIVCIFVVFGFPGLLLFARFLWKKYGNFNHSIPARLEEEAYKRIYLNSNEIEMDEIGLNLYEDRRSLMSSSKITYSSISPTVFRRNDTDSAIKIIQNKFNDNNVYWGISDFLYPNGIFIQNAYVTMIAPPGMIEDYLFYICNHVAPLTFLLKANYHPISNFTNLIIYVTAQTISLAIFVLYYKSHSQLQHVTVAEICLSPLTYIYQIWLQYTLLCPCFYGHKKTQRNRIGNDGDHMHHCNKGNCDTVGVSKTAMKIPANIASEPLSASTSSTATASHTSSFACRNCNNFQKYIQTQISKYPTLGKVFYGVIRLTGISLSFPVLLSMLILLQNTAYIIVIKHVPKISVFYFLLNILFVTTLVDMLLCAIRFQWFGEKYLFQIFGYKLLSVNQWQYELLNEQPQRVHSI